MSIKTLITSLHSVKITNKTDKKAINIFEDVSFLAKNNLSISEIEQFLGIKLSDYDKVYFEKNFHKYTNLFDHLNVLELIAYINFDQTLKKNLLYSLAKKIIYPTVLIVFAFITLLTFKFSVLPLFESFGSKSTLAAVNIFYAISIIMFISIVFLAVFTLYIFKRPTYFIMFYYRFYQFRLFRIIELYYISILCHLLISFDKQGLSTFATFKLINKFKGNTIIANLAYFVSADLEEGTGFRKSIENMQIDQNFKNVVVMGMQSGKYRQLLLQYGEKTIMDIESQISYISKFLLIITYLYIGIIVLMLYRILSLPISLIEYI